MRKKSCECIKSGMSFHYINDVIKSQKIYSQTNICFLKTVFFFGGRGGICPFTWGVNYLATFSQKEFHLPLPPYTGKLIKDNFYTQTSQLDKHQYSNVFIKSVSKMYLGNFATLEVEFKNLAILDKNSTNTSPLSK